MTNTEFLKLVLVGKDEITVPFLDWRSIMDGINDPGKESNMQIIDAAMKRMNDAVGGKADGFRYDPETGVLQLIAGEDPINGAAITINLTKYYTKEEVDKALKDLANNETIKEIQDTVTNIQNKAVGSLSWDETTRLLYVMDMSNKQIGEPIEITGGETATYDVEYDSENGTFNFLENGEVKSSFIVMGGGGGGGGGSKITLDVITPPSIVALDGETATIQYSFSSVDEDGDPLSGTYIWKVDNAAIQGASGECIIGLNTFDITQYLTYNDRRFTLVVTDSAGTMKTKNWTARKVDVRLESTFSDRVTREAGKPITFNYIPYGSGIEKTVHFRLDGVELPSAVVSLSAISQDYTIPAQSHGAHLLDCWITATIGNSTVETAHIYKDIICVDENSTVPIIGCISRTIPVAAGTAFDTKARYYTLENGEYVLWNGNADSWTTRPQLYYGSVAADQYDSTTIDYVVYKPGGGISDIIISMDGKTQTETTEELVNTIAYRTAVDGTHTITLTTGEEPNIASIGIIMQIAKLDIDITPVTTGLAFDFNPSGYSNGSIDKNAPWTYEKDSAIALSVSNGFDWNNGGFQLDADGNTAFCVKAGHRAYLSYKLFERDMKGTGSHFKLIFKTSNVKDINATFLSCVSGGVGLEMNVHGAKYMTSQQTLDAPYSEEDTIEFEYNVEPLDTTKDDARALVMIYEDGVAYRPMEYDNNHRLYQNSSPANITIGSDNCDVYIYRMTANTSTLSDRNVISNFIADALNAGEMIARYSRNQIYDAATGMLTPESLATACPWLKIIKIECPRFTTDKKDTVDDCNIQCIHKGGDPILDNWYATKAGHSGQGTTSNEYAVAGRNLDIKLNRDGTVITTGVSDVTNGIPITIEGSSVVDKVTLTRTSVPNAYFNIKVNIASSENANNALLQKRYDQFLPYTPISKMKDEHTKTIMEFVNCVVFVKETGVDSAGNSYTQQEFNDNEWHYYALGNIGDSKKTDKSRACDSNDPKEFTNEICDNTLANSIFDTGVYNTLVESLPSTGEKLLDYYVQNKNGTYTHSRYINGTWATVSNSVAEIINGASAVVSKLPAVGVGNIDYYIPTGGKYTLYTWDGTKFSSGTSRDAVEYNHMATAIAPEQWVVGNAKYDALMADVFDGDGTSELRYEHKNSDMNYILNVWRDMYKWVITSTDDEFKNDIGHWFIKDAVLYYYLFTERYTMTDNRAKNSFWHWSKVYISQAEADSTYADVQQYYTIDDEQAAINEGYRFDFWDYDNDKLMSL